MDVAFYNKIQIALQRLADQVLGGDDSSRPVFDEFLDHNELGLALSTLCDQLLKWNRRSIDPEWVAGLMELHAAMGMDDKCLSELVASMERHAVRDTR